MGWGVDVWAAKAREGNAKLLECQLHLLLRRIAKLFTVHQLGKTRNAYCSDFEVFSKDDAVRRDEWARLIRYYDDRNIGEGVERAEDLRGDVEECIRAWRTAESNINEYEDRYNIEACEVPIMERYQQADGLPRRRPTLVVDQDDVVTLVPDGNGGLKAVLRRAGRVVEVPGMRVMPSANVMKLIPMREVIDVDQSDDSD